MPKPEGCRPENQGEIPSEGVSPRLPVLSEWILSFKRGEGVGLDQGLVITHRASHQAMLDEQVVDEKLLLAGSVLLIDPELVAGNEPEPEVLAKIREPVPECQPGDFTRAGPGS